MLREQSEGGAHERAWQLIDRSGLNSMSVNPAYRFNLSNQR